MSRDDDYFFDDDPKSDLIDFEKSDGKSQRPGTFVKVILAIVFLFMGLGILGVCGYGVWASVTMGKGFSELYKIYMTQQTVSGQPVTTPAVSAPTPTLPPYLTADGSVKINSETFPDDIFREYVKDTIDRNGNGSLEEAEIQSVLELKIPGLGITSLTGIGFFSELEVLNCRDNGLSELDPGQNGKLIALDCAENLITKLDIRKSPYLGYLVIDPEVELTGEKEAMVVERIESTPQDPASDHEYVRIDQANFPDKYFRETVRKEYDSDDNGLLTEEERLAVTQIPVRCWGIKDLTGIGYFKNLEYIDCAYNELGSVDLSNNPGIQTIDVDMGVDVTGGPDDLTINRVYNPTTYRPTEEEAETDPFRM